METTQVYAGDHMDELCSASLTRLYAPALPPEDDLQGCASPVNLRHKHTQAGACCTTRVLQHSSSYSLTVINTEQACSLPTLHTGLAQVRSTSTAALNTPPLFFELEH